MPFSAYILQASEDRSQHMNRASALARLRTRLALKGSYHTPMLFLTFNLNQQRQILYHNHHKSNQNNTPQTQKFTPTITWFVLVPMIMEKD